MSPKKPIPKPGPFAFLKIPRNIVIFILICTAIHMGLTALFLYWNYSVLNTFYTSGKTLTWAGQLLGRLNEITQWPTIKYLSQNESLISSLPAYSFYVALFLNSLLWALVILGIMLIIRKFFTPKSRAN